MLIFFFAVFVPASAFFAYCCVVSTWGYYQSTRDGLASLAIFGFAVMLASLLLTLVGMFFAVLAPNKGEGELIGRVVRGLAFGLPVGCGLVIVGTVASMLRGLWRCARKRK